MALNESWNLKSRARECATTNRAFEDGESIFTALFQTEDGSFERLDFSSDGWEQRQASDESPPFSSWQSRFRAPESIDKPQVVEKENAEELLKRLIEEDEEATENVRYILTVMLERQKLLRETDRQRTPTGILRVYEHRKTGDVMIIRDPDIPLDRVEEVQEEVIAMLEPGGAAARELTPDQTAADSDQAPPDSDETATDPAEENPPGQGATS